MLDYNYYIDVYEGLLIKTPQDFKRNLLKAKAFLKSCYPHLDNILFTDKNYLDNYYLCLIELTEYYYNIEFNSGYKNGDVNGTNTNFLTKLEIKKEMINIIKTYIPNKYLYLGRHKWKM